MNWVFGPISPEMLIIIKYFQLKVIKIKYSFN